MANSSSAVVHNESDCTPKRRGRKPKCRDESLEETRTRGRITPQTRSTSDAELSEAEDEEPRERRRKPKPKAKSSSETKNQTPLRSPVTKSVSFLSQFEIIGNIYSNKQINTTLINK